MLVFGFQTHLPARLDPHPCLVGEESDSNPSGIVFLSFSGPVWQYRLVFRAINVVHFLLKYVRVAVVFVFFHHRVADLSGGQV